MTAYLAHIEILNPVFNAIVAIQDRELLLHQSELRDRQLARGDNMGPLHGFPLAIKDLTPVKGIPFTMGSPILNNFVPDCDSIMVERLRRAGAIFIGKTNTPEFGLGSNTYNSVYGSTGNAYDRARSAGGSSGGAAVALALRMLPLADGSDYGGSLRNPAGWNNVFGFRPTAGIVPAEAADAWASSMGVLGPMARNVPDLALLLSVQAGYDTRVPLSAMGHGDRFRVPLEVDPRGWRIGWSGNFGGQIPFEPGVVDLCEKAVRTLESLGCEVEEAQPIFPLELVWRAWQTLRAWQVGGSLRHYYQDPVSRLLMKPEAIFEVEQGLRLTAFDVSAASEVRTQWYQAVRIFFEKYDFFIAPTAQLFPFDLGMHWPTHINGVKMSTYHEWMQCALPISMSGCPALAAPAGFSPQGLPIGIQIVAPQHEELRCLQLADAYDRATRWSASALPSALAGG
jgi:amidase